MRYDIEKLVRDVADAEYATTRLKNQLASIRRDCVHQWDNPNGIYTPEITEAYTAPGHYHVGPKFLDVFVPRQEKPKWTKTCTVCGHVVSTDQVTTEKRVVPQW